VLTQWGIADASRLEGDHLGMVDAQRRLDEETIELCKAAARGALEAEGLELERVAGRLADWPL